MNLRSYNCEAFSVSDSSNKYPLYKWVRYGFIQFTGILGLQNGILLPSLNDAEEKQNNSFSSFRFTCKLSIFKIICATQPSF